MLISNSQQRLSCIDAQLNQKFRKEFKVIIITKKIIDVMSWYNAYSDNTRKLELLIDSKPTLEQLLEFPDFIQLLKAYQPKLLEYISNSLEVPREIIKYITQPPKETDSDSRKYKWPLLTIMMIETNTTCVINSFFKINPNTQKIFFLQIFDEFLSKDQELLPLLCGYFSQMNVTIWNNRYKEAIDLVYDLKSPLILLAKHTYNKAIINTLLLYLNLDLTRNPVLIPERTQLKLQVIKMFFEQIKSAFEASKTNQNNQRNEIIVQNICDILIEVVQKYYLITDGKSMLDLITTNENIELIMGILMSKSGISLSVVGLCIVLMRYYCLSSFNQEDPNNLELSKKNQQRLETQPFIKKITELVPVICEEIFKTSKFTIKQSRILEVFIPIIELSSSKLSETIKNCHFLQNLIGLFFKWPLLSIVHKQVERVFMAIFCLDKRICEDYRKHLFCSAGLIQMTAGECLKRANAIDQSIIKPGWFSYIMKIIKVYSKIQTNDEEINSAIIQRATLWEKFSSLLMRPYEAICFKDLGSYEGLPEKAPTECSVRTIGGGLDLVQTVCKKVVEEVIQEQSMQEFLTNMPEKTTEEVKSPTNPNEDALFMVQDFQRAPELVSHKSGGQQNQSVTNSKLTQKSEKKSPNRLSVPSTEEPSKNMESPVKPQSKKEETISKSFNDYLSSKKQEIGNELALQRRSSSEKRLSANKSRVTSPSPKKKRWDDTNSEPESKNTLPAPKSNPIPSNESRKHKISLTSQTAKPPMIPHQPKSPRPEVSYEFQKSQDLVVSSLTNISEDHISKSLSFQERKNLSTVDLSSSLNQEESRKMLSQSAVNLSQLKHIQFKRQRATKPNKSQFRKVGAKDKVFLQFLGVKI